MRRDAQLTLSSTVGADWQQLQAELARISVTGAIRHGEHNSVGGLSVAGLLMDNLVSAADSVFVVVGTTSW